MLLELDIRDFAIAEHVRLPLGPGLTVITGETGAGKSILIDALHLLLGARADAGTVRAGAAAAHVEGVFTLDDDALGEGLREQLDEAGVAAEDETLIVSRDVSLDGRARSAARVNGRAVVQTLLASLGTRLVDIHGQSDHVSLLQPATHIELLDRFGGAGEARRAFAEPAARLRGVRAEIDRLVSDERERVRRQERLRFEAEEIEAAELRPDEEDEVRAERQLLANAEQLAELADAAHAALAGGGRGAAAIDSLGRTADLLGQLAALDERMSDDAVTASGLQEQASDLARKLRAYRDAVEFNPARLAAVEERLTLLNTLKRKYGATIAAVIAYGEEASRELAELAGSEERVAALRAEERTLQAALGERATELSARREQAARRLVQAVEHELADLRLAEARFAVQFTRRASADGLACALPLAAVIEHGSVEAAPPADAPLAFDQSGVDRVEFLVSLNPGEPLRPLARVASGGETSRLMLALKSVLGEADAVPTLVFDEIEAGLGGRSAGVVAQKLAALAQRHQVICISHLPQIAAVAGTHLVAVKEVRGGRTRASLTAVSGEARIHELAAMLGGATPANLASARELLGITGENRARNPSPAASTEGSRLFS
ncbi:MAG TPA: DNA repair protein RecN [Dehalococcoidia bacterium]|nr:DNA repair protein RecN [Dehalococcoidia bacterium]